MSETKFNMKTGGIQHNPIMNSLNILKKNVKRDKAFLLLSLIPILYYFIFHYIPIYGTLIAFKDFSPGKGIWGSPWVGFEWFKQFFGSYYFLRLLRNTLLLSVYSIIFGFPVPIIFAVLLNEIRQESYKKFVQTVSYLPHFISEVVVVGMLVNFLSPNTGVVNVILNRLGVESIAFMGENSWFRPLYIGSGIWKSFGFNSIVYIAAIAGINQELYEAAEVDGISRFQKIIYITIPCISPTIITLLLLRLGHVMDVGFQKIILMYSPVIYDVSDVISTFVYRRGIVSGEYSFGAAVSLFNSVINLLLIITFNNISRKLSDTSLW